MPLAPLSRLLAQARERRSALTYCESWNLESLQAVIEAGEECRTPVIAGFNGGFLRHHGRRAPEDLSWYASFRTALDRACIPVAFLLNESDDLDQMRDAIELGFNAVMPDNEGFAAEDYVAIIRKVVAFAHPRDVWVEAQLGVLPSGSGSGGAGCVTDPEAAARFVDETGIDALAVSVGNVHILTEGKARLNLEALAAVANRVEVPLVLHGGTGIIDTDLKEAVRIGVAKVNFGTGLKQAYLAAVRDAVERYTPPMSPHSYLGKGGPKDILTTGREAVKAEAKRLITLLKNL